MSNTIKLVLAGLVGVAVGYATCHFMAKKHEATPTPTPTPAK